MNITDLLTNEGYIIVNKKIIELYGLDEAIIIGELSSEYNYYLNNNQLENDNSFYSTIENVEKNTSLSRYQQAKALNHLKELGLVEIDYRGIPPKRYIKQNFDKLINSQMLKNLTFKDEKILPLKIKKLNTNNNNININNIINIYSDLCTNLPKINKLTEKRKSAIKRFLKEFTEDDFRKICETANKSEFLIGDNDRGWKADFDFLLRIDKANAILEGKYNFKNKENKANFQQRNYDDFNKFYV